MVEAGLSPWRALCTATVNAAKFIGETNGGLVAPGARADLVVIDSDPLDDISALRRQSGVVVNGRWLPKRKIEEIILSAG